MEAATLVASDSSYSYQAALAEVSKKFVEDKVVGDMASYKPLVAPSMSYGSNSNVKDLVTTATTDVELSKSVGSSALTEGVTGQALAVSMCHEVQAIPGQQITVSGIKQKMIGDNSEQQLTAWHGDYDKTDWEAEMKNNPLLQKALGGGLQVSVGSRIGNNLAGNSFHLGANCVINFICGKNDDNKENNPGK